MRIVLRLFGVLPLLSLDVGGLFVEAEGKSEPEDTEGSIEGGSAHDFERDVFPLSPTAHHEWEWEDRKRGFGFR